jgi:hypothetical protein
VASCVLGYLVLGIFTGNGFNSWGGAIWRLHRWGGLRAGAGCSLQTLHQRGWHAAWGTQLQAGFHTLSQWSDAAVCEEVFSRAGVSVLGASERSLGATCCGCNTYWMQAHVVLAIHKACGGAVRTQCTQSARVPACTMLSKAHHVGCNAQAQLGGLAAGWWLNMYI